MTHMMMRTLGLIALFFIATLPVRAESLVYVSDRVEVALTAKPGGGKVVARVTSGDPVDALENRDGFVRVRAPSGDEGWLAEALVMPDKPARLRLMDLEAERGALRARAREAEAKAAAGGAAGSAVAMEQELAALREENGRLTARIDAAAAALSGQALPAGAAAGGSLLDAWPWLLGLLLLGFIAGLSYHRYRHCRTHGGIRITLG